MRRLLPPALVIVILVFLIVGSASAGTFYIAANGSDSNSGTSKSSPWLHAPGMSGATGNAAGYTPVAGDQFVLRGCDTWTLTGQWNLPSSGSSGNLVTWGGLDQAWYNTSVCPSGWNRPILSGGGAWPGSAAQAAMEFNSTTYNSIQWLEFTNFYWTRGGQVKLMDIGGSGHNDIENNYVHGMVNATPNTNGSASFAIYDGSGKGNTKILYNVLDLSDSSSTAQQTFNGMYGYETGAEIAYNYMAYMGSCAVISVTLFHDNVLDNCGIPDTEGEGLHNNNYENNSERPGGSFYYNNVTTNSGGAANLPGVSVVNWQLAPSTGQTVYVFNNIFANMPEQGSSPISCSSKSGNGVGTCVIFNNTIECGFHSDGANFSCIENGDGGSPNATLNAMYNHQISSKSGSSLYNLENGSTISATPNPNLVETVSAATSGGYSLSNFFAPTSSSGSTVGAGGSASTMQGYCSTISAINAAAGAACQYDATQAVSYNTGSHTVAYPARTANPRPTTGNWDTGAYQYASGNTPNPPTGLAAQIQ